MAPLHHSSSLLSVIFHTVKNFCLKTFFSLCSINVFLVLLLSLSGSSSSVSFVSQDSTFDVSQGFVPVLQYSFYILYLSELFYSYDFNCYKYVDKSKLYARPHHTLSFRFSHDVAYQTFPNRLPTRQIF